MATTYSSKEVIVADNASTDDSVDFLRENYPAVRIISLDRNYGFARGYNEALRQVEADYYVLLNSDVETTPGWIEPVIALMEKDGSIGACQPKILSCNDKHLFEYAGAAGGWIDYLGYPFSRGRIFDVCEEDEGQYDTIEPVFWATGAAMFVRGSLFHGLGGLDNYFFAHMEEIDFCWRLQLAGHAVYACPESVVYHLGGGTLPKGNERKIFLNFRNNLIMMAKNMPVGEAIRKIVLRFVLDAISALKSLSEGHGGYFLAVWKAHFAFLYWLLLKRGESVFPIKKTPVTRGESDGRLQGKLTPKLEGWLNQSIVWAYFVRKQKTFGEIVKNKQ